MSQVWFYVAFYAITLIVTTAAAVAGPSKTTSTALGSLETASQPLSDLELLNESNSGNYSSSTLRKPSENNENYDRDVFFKFFKDGQLLYIADGVNVEKIAESGCKVNDQFAFLIHGWKESCDIEWMHGLIDKLTIHRGGCIICVDYGKHSQGSYVRLLRKFEPLTQLMTNKLKYYHSQGLDPNKVFMFGFSYGGQLSTAIGKNFGVGLIKEIDTCDMAGPGFDYKISSLDHRDAAQNVQCIHTSRDKGTRTYECHQNWRMGNCGLTQVAAEQPPKGSHGLCPYFYTSAFDNPFYAVEQPKQCSAKHPAASWPENFKMGYTETRKSLVNGELFAITSDSYPFNVLDPNAEVNISKVGYRRVRKFRPVVNAIKRARYVFRHGI